MNPNAILALISELYTQISVLSEENRSLKAKLNENRTSERIGEE